ncbi:hypothetical protein DdX_21661 [Ditylenchus destructor]|uniref:Uncharacterized protein n=1 Tax=Ditylenchus destructor TaxID=166010 RepID=A0AAD4MF76_9BILA|nr:hypothetical protein DdX_21661 [Ditylenchus destructor]
MNDSVHRRNANMLKNVEESFNDCAKKFITDNLAILQAGWTPKPKTCLKTNIEIKRKNLEDKRNKYGHANKIPAVMEVKLPLEKKQIETLVLELEKSYPFEQSESQYGKVRKLVKPTKSADLQSVWDLVQNAVDAGFSITERGDSGPAVIKLFNKELSPEEYDEWVVRNNYSKQISPIYQAAGDRRAYELIAYGYYKDLDKQLLDFFATGSHCTSEVFVIFNWISKAVIVDFVQKFMDLKSRDDSQLVESIRGYVSETTAEAMKNNYVKFFTQGNYENRWNVEDIFELVNADIAKKLQLTISQSCQTNQVILKIINL